MSYNFASRCFFYKFNTYKVFLKHVNSINRNINSNSFVQVCRCSSACNLTSKNVFLTSNQNNLKLRRNYGTEQPEKRPEHDKLPPLMQFPKLVWPSFFKSVRNFILATFIIKPYMDNDFSLSDFVNGSKKAVEVVSNKISSGDLKSLNGLVTSDVIPTLQNAISVMSLSQREQLAISPDDIYFSFPYQVGIIFDDDEPEDPKDQKRFVEITMVYHTLKGLSQMRSKGEEPPLNMGMMPEYRNKISICNYRFIREFTKGVESDWTINLLNHFKPADELEEE